MLSTGLLITIIGMAAVYAFLVLLLYAIKLMSFVVGRLERTTAVQNDKIAALVAIALQRGENK